ncbi:glycosyltransferase family 4 protein [uncultured Veillonella sp.]|uniref:glycosyltransferase family 4 protein n=1 Tax=uncultured Veillonella sp. TaxID=159268 RepID=UPI0028DAF983|nr:glycosyltransferase family 4 protein [uncultured Veillonella sp.]
MSILNVVGAKVWGGGEQYVYDMCDELHRRHIPSFVLVDASNHELQERFEQVAEVLTGNLYSCKGFTSILSIASQIKEQNITVIQCHSGKYILLCIALKRLTGAKLVFYKHNVVKAKTDMYHRWIQSEVDAFICVSKKVYDAQIIPSIASKYYLVYNGINTHRFPVLSDSNSSISNKPFIVGYAGRIIENKGIFELLDAIRLIHTNTKDIRLVICGDGKPNDIERMNWYINQHQMAEYVQYVGFQKDMNQWYRSIHCLVAPSKVQEAFGLVLCEAMYCKVPVITSISGAQAEIIENGVSGILIDTINSESISEAIQGLMNNDALRTSIIEQGYTRVESTFTIAKMVDSIDKIVRNLR